MLKYCFKALLLIQLLMPFTANYAAVAVRGINYDPAHNQDYLTAQRNGNLETMKAQMNADLDKIKKMGFNTVKTFYSVFCTHTGKCVNFMDLAGPKNLNVVLGVFEFPDNLDWTASQVKAAIDSAKKYPKQVVGIMVGNEDAYIGYSIMGGMERNNKMQQRIVADVRKIKQDVTPIPVSTAQVVDAWRLLAKEDPHGILKTVDVVAVNVYPFWGGAPVDRGNVVYAIQNTVQEIKNLIPNKSVLVAEEGWPSGGNSAGYLQNRDAKSQGDYFKSWLKRLPTDTFQSYYFSAYDKLPEANVQGDNENYHFGLCLTNGKSKDASQIISCE